jgi:hypothetical protein
VIRPQEGWKTLDGYSGSYKEFKKSILDDYPEVIAMSRGSITKLEQICKEYQRLSELDLQEILQFERCFRAEASKLTKEPALLANHTLVEKFSKVLIPEFWDRVFSQLDSNRRNDEQFHMNVKKLVLDPGNLLKDPTHNRPEDKFTLNEVITMTEQLACGRNPGQSSILDVPVATARTAEPPVRIKTENIEFTLMEEICSQMANMRDVQDVSQKEMQDICRVVQQTQSQNQQLAQMTAVLPAPQQLEGPGLSSYQQQPQYRPSYNTPVSASLMHEPYGYYPDKNIASREVTTHLT